MRPGAEASVYRLRKIAKLKLSRVGTYRVIGAMGNTDNRNERVRTLRARAGHACRLSALVADNRAHANLLDFAAELDGEADALEREPVSEAIAKASLAAEPMTVGSEAVAQMKSEASEISGADLASVYRDRATRLRIIAANLLDPEHARLLGTVADDYEQLASKLGTAEG